MEYKVPLVLTPQPEGGYTVTSPLLPELVTKGDSLDESLENVKDAFEAVMALYEDRTYAFFCPSLLDKGNLECEITEIALFSILPPFIRRKQRECVSHGRVRTFIARKYPDF